MKSLFTGWAVMTFAALVGCSQGTPGGPGTTETKPAYGQADNTFNLSVPVMSSSLKQGEQTEATVGIKRAKNFDEDVALKFADVPQGVTVEPANPVIKHGDTDVKITFKAGDDAALGDFAIKVTGHPAKGAGASNEFKLTVAKKSEEELAAVDVTTPGLAGQEMDSATKRPEGNAGAVDETRVAGELASREMIFRSTELSEMNVYNRADTTLKLGSLENLVVNAHTGQVLFGVLDTGFGGKLIPVPWNALRLQKDATTQKSSLMLHKTSEELQNSPTIEKNSVVDMTDATWLQSLDTFFDVRTVARPVIEQTQPGKLTTNEMILRSSDLHGMKISNRTDESEELGSISDLIVDAHTGQVLYGILDTESGGTLIAAPWNAFQLKEDVANNKSWLTLNKTSEELKNASTVDMSHLPDFTEMKWRQTVDEFFGVRTGAEPSETNR